MINQPISANIGNKIMYDKEMIEMIRESDLDNKTEAVLTGWAAQVAAISYALAFICSIVILYMQKANPEVATSLVVGLLLSTAVIFASVAWLAIVMNKFFYYDEIRASF